METLAILYRLLQLTPLLMGIGTMVSKREVSTRTIVIAALVVVVVLAAATGTAEALRIGVPAKLLGYVFGATALFFGLPGLAVATGVILLRRDRRQIWLRVGVLTALYLVAAHVGLKLVTRVSLG